MLIGAHLAAENHHTVEQDVAKLIADNPHLRVYYKTIQKWWDGYDGEEIVVHLYESY